MFYKKCYRASQIILKSVTVCIGLFKTNFRQKHNQRRIHGGRGEWQEWLVTPCSLQIYLLKYLVPSQMYTMCLLECLVICEKCCIILWVIQRIAYPMKANASFFVQALYTLFWKGLSFLKAFRHVTQLYSRPVLPCLFLIIYLHSSLCQVEKWEE